MKNSFSKIYLSKYYIYILLDISYVVTYFIKYLYTSMIYKL